MLRSLIDRITLTKEYEACILAIVSPDADPNVTSIPGFKRGKSPVESLAGPSLNSLGGGDRPPDGAAAGGASYEQRKNFTRSRAGDSRENQR